MLGDAQFDLYLKFEFPHDNSLRTVSLHPVLIPWNDASTTWNSFGVTPGVDFGTDVLSTPLASIQTRFDGGGYRTWTIPAATVQSWIDTPADNHGFLVALGPTDRDFYWRANEDSSGTPPLLSFQAVPEPSNWAAGAVAALVLCHGSVRWVRRVRLAGSPHPSSHSRTAA